MASYDQSWLQRRRRLFSLLGLLLLGAVICCVIESYRDPWSRLYNEKQELDLYSGRARITWHRLYLQTGQEIRETPLSESLGSGGEHASDEKWVTVNVFGFGGGISPHFAYHGALADIDTLAKYWEMYNFDEAARAKTARQLLKVFRHGESYFADREFFRWLVEWSTSRPFGQPTTAKDDPDDLLERCLSTREEASKKAPSSQPSQEVLCVNHHSTP